MWSTSLALPPHSWHVQLSISSRSRRMLAQLLGSCALRRDLLLQAMATAA